MAEPIVFYTEFSSPYAYIASKSIDALAARHGRTVRWRPIPLYFVFKTLYDRPDAGPKVKRDYIMMDSARSADLLGIRMVQPAVFPLDGKLARRVFYRLEAEDPALAVRFAKLIFDTYWGEGTETRTVDQVAPVAARLGVSRATVEAANDDAAAKTAERAAFDDAMKDGMFGAPYFVVDGEKFWGADRLDHIDLWLARQEKNEEHRQ
ncbi:MAG: 2-hydroxychromene-2-carboxylate isomerase [Alphaproteobacteria bacterium]|nr:2-hydroxychromene-2-carboxylate isomerase [Alphaproteobacteria bacterium]